MASVSILKAAPPVADTARDALRLAVANKADADAALAAHVKHADDLRARAWQADNAVEAAKGRLDEVRTATVRHIADPSSPAPAMSQREARRALEDAEEEFTTISAARASRPDRDPEFTVKLADEGVTKAVAAVLAELPAVRALVLEYRQRLRDLVDLRGALWFLEARGALPADVKGRWGGEEAWPNLQAEKAWRATFDALACDADAALP